MKILLDARDGIQIIQKRIQILLDVRDGSPPLEDVLHEEHP
jgi:hypothetical protein